MSRRVIVAGRVGTALLAAGAYAAWRGGVFGPATPPAATQSQPDADASTAAPLTYVGSAACRDCHAAERVTLGSAPPSAVALGDSARNAPSQLLYRLSRQ